MNLPKAGRYDLDHAVERMAELVENKNDIRSSKGKVMPKRKSIHGEWSSRAIFVMAAAGSAVGLGNIWKFPYIAGENGGGAFVLIYLLCIAAIGLPVMMAEILLGRRGRQSPINTMLLLAKEQGTSKAWSWIGWGGVVAGFLILSYYSVIAGWALAYVVESGSGAFAGASAEQIGGIFDGLVGSWFTVLFWHTLFLFMTMVVVARGVRGGLEKAVTFLMPALFILLVIMVVSISFSVPTSARFFMTAR